MQKRQLFHQIGSRVMGWILKSPLHGMLSRSTLLIEVTGRKTGMRHSLPVNYLRQGHTLLITSRRSRTWWRNLRGGYPVHLWLNGVETAGQAAAFENLPAVKQGLAEYLGHNPALAKYFEVGLDGRGCPKAEDMGRAAESRVIVRVTLSAENKKTG